ncbi:mannose-6-phosphate isomerase [Blastochloris viridis]|uniref:Mannose-6-phosphate isomerase n=1 Tax=Blastochloris viridis TaxID=1079 RepID=A0A182D3U3_BLAVI|nr:mannose-6-phosphate isomerase [Blastochloris viridis]
MTQPVRNDRPADPALAAATRQAGRWLREAALPLWASRGFDPHRDAFEEQLHFTGEPVAGVPRRTMVQARQIAVFAAAALSGRFPGANLALRAAQRWVRAHLASDGRPGWVFSVDRDGGVVDGRRDLYAHAFALFALALVMRLQRDRAFDDALAATLDIVDGAFADPAASGYWDCLPRQDRLRRQNPHMHLFEAFLALWQTTQRDDMLARCRRLQQLALRRFLDPDRGALREQFDDRWTVHPAPGQGAVEPGHLFEWAWLLRRYEHASGEDQTAPVTAMLDFAIRAGLDAGRGRIVDEIGESGELRARSSRSWPHTEALKALAAEAGRGNLFHRQLIAPIGHRLMTVHCRPDLKGGWIDHVDADDRPISTIMPASTLYHLYFGISALEELP